MRIITQFTKINKLDDMVEVNKSTKSVYEKYELSKAKNLISKINKS